MRRLLLISLLLLPAALWATSDPVQQATDRAYEALAQGNPTKAVSALSGALGTVTDDDDRQAVQCLLGRAHLAAGQAAEAEQGLAEVAADHACGAKAAYLRAEALQALGRVDEAVEIYATVGGARLGPDRDAMSAEAIADIALKLLRDPAKGQGAALPVAIQALSLEIAEARHTALTRRLVDAFAAESDELWNAPHATGLCGALQQVLAREDDAGDRLRAAEVCRPEVAWRLMTPLEETPERLHALARRVDPHAAEILRERALGLLESDNPLRRELEEDQTLARGHLGRLDGVAQLLEDGRPEALKAATALWIRAGEPARALQTVDRLLAAFPADPERKIYRDRRGTLALQLARQQAAANQLDEALAAYDDLLENTPDAGVAPQALLEAGLLLRTQGRLDAARERWNLVRARWPHQSVATTALGYLARLRILDDGKPAEGFDWLRSQRGAAGQVEDELRATDVQIAGPAATVGDAVTQRPVVRVQTRNLERVELRLHRIDAEAYLRAGGQPSSLRDLDVAVVAPDTSWTVEVPEYEPYADVAFDVPVSVDRPGLYSVTVASPEEEASTLVLVSDLTLVAQSVGSDLVVASFDRAGNPAGGVRVVVKTEGATLEGRTDRTGLWRAETPVSGQAVVLGLRGDAPAFLELHPSGSSRTVSGLTVSAQLERSVALPGDTLGLWAVAQREGRPVRGAWTLWLEVAGRAMSRFTVEANARGQLVADLPVPRMAANGVQVKGLPPDTAAPVTLATFAVVDELAPPRTLESDLDDEGVTFTVREPSGAPAADVPIVVDGEVRVADAAGQVRVLGPGPGIDWFVEGQIAGTGIAIGDHRPFEGRPWLAFDLADDRLRPGEAPEVRLVTKEGNPPVDVRVQVIELVPGQPLAPAPEDPWRGAELPDIMAGAEVWEGSPDAATALERVIQSFDVVVTDAGVALPLEGIEAGQWRIRAVPLGGFPHASASVDLRVEDTGLRLLGARRAALGLPLSLGVDGAAALVTASADRLLWAAVMTPGTRQSVEVGGDWPSAAQLSAVAPDGQRHERLIEVDPRLQVDVSSTAQADGTFAVEARVTDGAGRPVKADVSLAAWDRWLEATKGAPHSTLALPQTFAPQPRITAATTRFQDADAGTPVAGALQTEARREAERKKAKSARRGLLSDEGLAGADVSALIEGTALGGLGARGSGLGGGGYGAGSGNFGSSGGRAVLVDTALPGVRERVLWSVQSTDDNGVVRATLAGPPARYRVRATAVQGRTAGEATHDIDTRTRVWLLAAAPAPGFPGDRATPLITLVNGLDTPFEGEVVVGEDRVPVALPPRGAATATLGEPRAPGPQTLAVQAVSGGQTVARTQWAFPLAEGTPNPEGPLVTVQVGPRGTFPAEAVALAPDPGLSRQPWRHAARGRTALAALAVTDSPRLRRAIRDARDGLRLNDRRPTAADAAHEVLFLAELRDAGLLDVTAAEIKAAASRLQQTATVEAGAWTALARARAGLPVDPDLLAFLTQAELPDEAAGVFARALGWLGRSDEARARATGFHGAVARLDLGDPVEPAMVPAHPPAVGDGSRADWFRLAARPGRSDRPTATVRIGGNPAATLDLTRAAEVRFLADGEVTVDAPGALVLRSDVPLGGLDSAPVVATRLPAGADGRPLDPATTVNPDDPWACSPCVLRVGDGLWLSHAPLPTWQPSMLRRVRTPQRIPTWVATTPGRTVLRGLRKPDGTPLADLTVEVLPSAASEPLPSPLAPGYQLTLAEQAVAAERATEVPAARAHPQLVGRIARVGLSVALLGEDDPAIVTQFQQLVAVQPQARVTLAEVARVAQAMAGQNRLVDAARVWRAGLDAAFGAEGARVQEMSGHLGPLATIRLVRDAAFRYPDGPAVGDAQYLLPNQLWTIAEGKPDEAVIADTVTALDLRLTAAAWDRELLATNPDHPRAAAAGLRLARSMLALNAPEAAAQWAQRVAEAHPEDPLSDALTYLEALAWTEAGKPRAESLLKRLIDQPFPDPSGRLGPSVHRTDAQLVFGRLHEARGDYPAAVDAYEAVAASVPEAARSAAALSAKRVEIDPLVVLGTEEEALIELNVQGVDELALRAYAIDLRTVFLRDGGLGEVRDVAVAGVSPTWSGTRKTEGGPFPEERQIRLPLEGLGAWLVHADHEGGRATTLVVRSSLTLTTSDEAGMRRVTVRREDRPAGDVQLRVLAGGQISARTTDVRGVVEVPTGAAVLAFDGPEYAFTPPDAPAAPGRPAPVVPQEQALPLQQLDQRLGRERQRDNQSYQRRFKRTADEAMSLETL